MTAPTQTAPAGREAPHRLNTHHALLGFGLMLVVLGGFTAHEIQTVGGSVRVADVRFDAQDGRRLAALLYTPDGVDAQHKAPGILAIHGYINSRETQSGFAIEFARRGYVVLALDMAGHGASQPPAFRDGFGGPDGLRYLRSLDSVDTDNVGIEGHSMGGWAALAAAESQPDGYRAIVLVGSGPGVFGAPAATVSFPRNLAVIFGTYDEFSQLMWDAPTGAAIVRSAKLRQIFGTPDPVEPERLYGHYEYGTARTLFAPDVTHPGEHLSTTAIAEAVDWFAATLHGATPQPARHQIWYWKEFATLIAMIGMVTATVGFGLTILQWRYVRELAVPHRPAPSPRRAGLAAALIAVIPALTYFPLFHLADVMWPVTARAPQQLTNGVMLWALANAAIGAAATGLLGRGTATLASTGIWPAGFSIARLAGAALFAAATVAFGYLLLFVTTAAFEVDFRFWVIAFKTFAPWHVKPYLMYLLPMTLLFVTVGASLQPFVTPVSTRRAAVRCVLILTNGFLALLAIQYVPLLSGIPMPLGEPLLTILAIQFVVLLAIAGLVVAVFQRATGSVYAAAFINALLITWPVVAGQATQFAI